MSGLKRDIHSGSKKRIMEKLLTELRDQLTSAEDTLNTLYMLGYNVDEQIVMLEHVDQQVMQACRVPQGYEKGEQG